MSKSYFKTLKLLSQSIYDLGNPHENTLNHLLSPSSKDRIKIYQRHLFGNIYNVLSQDFIGCLRYLAYNNFRFLVKEFIVECSIKSANIFDSSKEFKDFIHTTPIHQDPTLPYLADLDYFWSYAPSHVGQTLMVPKNITPFWRALYQGTPKDPKPPTTLGASEPLSIVSVGDEWRLSALIT